MPSEINNNIIEELPKRFELRKTKYLPERVKISPNITQSIIVKEHLSICFAPADSNIVDSVSEALISAYDIAKNWFGINYEVPIQLWIAPELIDMNYMLCNNCPNDLFCAPGKKNGYGIIAFQSPRTGKRNRIPERLKSLLGHEISHHMILDISGATNLAMTRRINNDLPMWLEEGICQIVQADLNPQYKVLFNQQIEANQIWYKQVDLWDDLSSCNDVPKAYLQGYRDACRIINEYGKDRIISLLKQNKNKTIDWGIYQNNI